MCQSDISFPQIMELPGCNNNLNFTRWCLGMEGSPERWHKLASALWADRWLPHPPPIDLRQLLGTRAQPASVHTCSQAFSSAALSRRWWRVYSCRMALGPFTGIVDPHKHALVADTVAWVMFCRNNFNYRTTHKTSLNITAEEMSTHLNILLQARSIAQIVWDAKVWYHKKNEVVICDMIKWYVNNFIK